MSSLRQFLYTLARVVGDVNAVEKKRVQKRIHNRIVGRVVGKMLRNLMR